MTEQTEREYYRTNKFVEGLGRNEQRKKNGDKDKSIQCNKRGDKMR